MQRPSIFLLLLAAAFAALFSTPCVNAQNANVTITSIKTLTTASNDLRVTTSQISITNIFTTGARVGAGLVSITSSIRQVVKTISVPNPQTFNDDEAAQVVAVLTTFVQVHQALLSTIIGKHGLLAQFGFAEPVRLALVALEGLVDTLASLVIGLIPTRAIAGTAAKTSLDQSLGVAIQAYS